MADSIPSTEIEWRPVVGFPDYEISEDGRIRRVGKPRPGYPHKHELIPWVFDRYGHMTIRLTVNGKRYTRAVHRLVAETFIGPRPTPRHGVAHWDGNPAHNHWKNLRWATQAENAADTVRHGRTNAGEKNPSAKVTAAQVAEIRKRYATGHERICDLAAEFDMHYVNMSNLLHGKSWRKNGTPVSDGKSTRL